MLRLVLIAFALTAVAAVSGEPQSDGYPVTDQASERIPPATVQGVTNQRFQWMPGPLVVIDIAEHYWTKYKAWPWLKKNAIPTLEKYIPLITKWEGNYEKARNLIIILTPAVLKAMHKI